MGYRSDTGQEDSGDAWGERQAGGEQTGSYQIPHGDSPIRFILRELNSIWWYSTTIVLLLEKSPVNPGSIHAMGC